MATNEVKKNIIAKYDAEARERDNEQWLSAGHGPRVPESKASHYFIDRKVNTALTLCGSSVSSHSRALEIGCSWGHMTSLLATHFDNLTAVDISPKSVELAEERMKRYGITNVSFVVDDAETLHNLHDGTFDVVFSFSTIRFCPSPEKALAAIHQKLKPGGVAIIDFPNKYSPWHMFVKPATGIKRHIHDHLYTLPEAIALFKRNGFEIADTKRFLFTSKRFPDFVVPLAALTDFVLERVPPFPAIAGIIMVKGIKT